MNIFPLRLSFLGMLALILLSALAPTSLKASKSQTPQPSRIKLPTTFLRTAVPEPSSFVLLGSGLVLAAFALRKKGIGLR